jgi:hypothetical protein
VSDREMKPAGWQTPFQDLLDELDHDHLLEKIQMVETLIFERLQQLHREHNGCTEDEGVKDALSILRGIKRDKLGFPDWK